MNLPIAWFTDPRRNAPFGIAVTAISFFVFAYSTDYGKPAILLLYACWFPLLVLSPQLVAGGWQRLVPILILPTVCVISTVWSDYPGATLRAALQYATTIACGLIAARAIAQQTLVAGGLSGMVLVLLYSFAHGHYHYDVIDGSYAYAGAFASKNQLGYFASLGILFSLSAWLLFGMGLFWRLFAVAIGLACAFALVKSDSATAEITVMGAIMVIGGAIVLFRFRPGDRRIALAVGIVLALVFGIVLVEAGAFGDLLAAFGKNTTLTGRTYLWSVGLEQGATRPALGVGYQAFWIVGRPLAEELWQQFFITGKTGFHFHDTMIEAYVELGILGVVVVGSLLLSLLILPIRVLMNRRRTGEAALAAALALMFVVRSAVEIDFYTPYTAGTFLVAYLVVQMLDQRAAEVGEIARPEPARGRLPAEA